MSASMSAPRRSARIAAIQTAQVKNIPNLKPFMGVIDLERPMRIEHINAATACVTALHTNRLLNTNEHFRSLVCKKLDEFLEDVLPCEWERVLKWTPAHINTTNREGALMDLQEACESLNDLLY
jgi:hypothetical protein